MLLKDLPKSQWLKQLPSKICEWPLSKWIKAAELHWISHAQQDLNFNEKSTVKLDNLIRSAMSTALADGLIKYPCLTT
jgi:hypothetical protein